MMAQIRPRREKLYAFAIPMIQMRATDGQMALGAFAKAAIPPGIDKPPLPTIFLSRLEISSPIPATACLPQDSDSKTHFGLNFALEFSSIIDAVSASSSDLKDALDDVVEVETPPYSNMLFLGPPSGSASGVEEVEGVAKALFLVEVVIFPRCDWVASVFLLNNDVFRFLFAFRFFSKRRNMYEHMNPML